MTADMHIINRRAIEALRSGVPNRYAVEALGCQQPTIQERFLAQLRATNEGLSSEEQSTGLLVVGDFGTGKSHLLEHLNHIALDQNFVCSKLVISKETPLHDPVKLYRSAASVAVAPMKCGSAFTELAWKLDTNAEAFARLEGWVTSMGARLNSRFAASLLLFKKGDEEMVQRMISFWSGEPLGGGDVRRDLRACGERPYRIEKARVKDLAIQRFLFAPRLMIAAGYAGWVLFIDEVELIGRYSPLQRAKSYVELARLFGRLGEQQFPGLTTVFAIMSNFEAEVLEEKNDLEDLPAKVRDKGLDELAKHAQVGMRILRKEKVGLSAPDADTISRTRDEVRAIYAQAYGWEPQKYEEERTLASTVMREHVRTWINEWDLKRLYPEYSPATEVHQLTSGYAEDADLEGASGDGSEHPAPT